MHPAGGKEAGEQLLSLRQGRGLAAEYALSFRTLSAQSAAHADVEPMQIGVTLVSEKERERDAFDRAYACTADYRDIYEHPVPPVHLTTRLR